jgi:hypothetical protein
MLIQLVEFADKVSFSEIREISGIFTLPHKSMLEFLIEAGAIKEEANKAFSEGPFQKSPSPKPGEESVLK